MDDTDFEILFGVIAGLAIFVLFFDITIWRP